MSLRSKAVRVAEELVALVSDRAYLSFRFRRQFGRWPSLRNPRSFNEHLLHYKLGFRDRPLVARLTDKIAVKQHVANLIGVDHVIPTLWYGDRLPDRSDRNWPKPYVIKSAHGSNQNLFVRTAADEDWDSIERSVSGWLSEGYRNGRLHRETQYETIPRRILVEPMIGDAGLAVPADYKLWVFGGRVELLWKDEDRYAGQKRYTFDRDWKPLPFDFYHRRGPEDPPPPKNLAEMIKFAEILGRDFPFVSVDLYEVQGRIYFGEMTFSPAGGNGPFFPSDADYFVGQLWPSDS